MRIYRCFRSSKACSTPFHEGCSKSSQRFRASRLSVGQLRNVRAFAPTFLANTSGIDPQKLGPDAIAQIARNAAVGTGSTDRLHFKELTAAEARAFLDQGAL